MTTRKGPFIEVQKPSASAPGLSCLRLPPLSLAFFGAFSVRELPFLLPEAAANASAARSAVFRLIHNWINTPTMLLTIQYNTSPLGAEKKNSQVNIIGISQVIITRCIFIDGSAEAGCGVSLVDAIIVTHITIGRILNGSGLDRSVNHKTHGACRTSREEPRY